MGCLLTGLVCDTCVWVCVCLQKGDRESLQLSLLVSLQEKHRDHRNTRNTERKQRRWISQNAVIQNVRRGKLLQASLNHPVSLVVIHIYLREEA